MQPNLWLPLTEYALRSGMSISTLRRKIKSNNIDYRMEEGRYLIRSDDLQEEPAPIGFTSTDNVKAEKIKDSVKEALPAATTSVVAHAVQTTSSALPSVVEDLEKIREELRLSKEENSLRWRALEARVAGIAKKLDFFTEQMSEIKMLVKIFEEKLDDRA